jgi:hypothetical protein
MTKIYFATPIAKPAIDCFRRHAHEATNVLVSFAFRKQVDGYINDLPNATFMLDSGAYTAWSCGQSIDLYELMEYARNPRWHEVVALDVIGDAEASVRNADIMRANGLTVMPVYHIGDPIEHLQHYKAHFPKVGLSCRFGEPKRDSLRFLDKAFTEAWPYCFHSFGWISDSVLRRYPFDSADASTWVNPHRFGAVKAAGDSMSGGTRGPSFRLNRQVSSHIDLWMVVQRYKALERSLTSQWRRELAKVRHSSASKCAAQPNDLT